MKKERVLNRLTGKFEVMTALQEARYHIDLCNYDLDDPTASRARKRRAGDALARWRTRLRELEAHE